MTYITNLPTLFNARLLESTVGFDRFFAELDEVLSQTTRQSNYPPFNIRQLGDDQYQIEVAVAGFRPEELEVAIEKNLLTIRGERQSADDDAKYLHQGLAYRSFERTIPIKDTIQVLDCTIEHGVLLIRLENVIPERDKKKLIPIKMQ